MAILIDGGFYRIRAAHLWGKKPPEQRVTELIANSNLHKANVLRPLQFL